MQSSPKKSFKTPKSISSPQTLSEPNYNERYIQNRFNSQISSFSLQDKIETDNTEYSNLIHHSLFDIPQTYLFNTEVDIPTPSRKISSKPYKVLDAPDLQDNFYYSILDWSSLNLIAVALSSQVYIYEINSCKVYNLFSSACDITSLRFDAVSQYLSIGLESGQVIIFDINKQECVSRIQDHKNRVGVLAWKENIVSSGGHDSYLVHRDLRAAYYFFKAKAHKEEICGMAWDGDTLATGSNDNTVKLWDGFNPLPNFVLKGHTSAIKSMAWSPHERKVLLTGGGSNDRTIRTWSALDGKCAGSIDTGSQVCGLFFSKHSKELVSGHGYSRNEIAVWRYNDMKKISAFKAHDERVLYMAMSPDGKDIVTGAGDKTLRFWSIFDTATQDYHTSQFFFESIR
jgi:cell division cycle 20-like protein 1, cofactor of APC complex